MPRVHILAAVNAANVSRSADGSTYTVANVCGATDDLVMNQMLYPADHLAAGAPTLNGKPAPAGHPKNAAGKHISALNGEALLGSYIGAVCRNARHEGGRTLVDVTVNAAQARAIPAGAELITRLDAAINGTNADPIHVSTGLLVDVVNAAGESRGKKYSRIATNLRYDHLAILLNERGAGTPDDGVGMFLNAAGEEEEIEAVEVNETPVDRRAEGLLASAKALFGRLIGNTTDVSFDAIYEGLRAGLPDDRAWLREVFERYAVWVDRDGKLFKQDYSVASDGSVAFSGNPVEVQRRVSYVTVTNQEDEDSMKPQIVAALNAAGIKTDGLDEAQLLSAYNSLVTTSAVKPVEDKLTAANSRIAEFEAERTRVENAERDTLATELAVNSSLTAEDFKAMPLARLKELKAKAAPVVVGNTGTKTAGGTFAGYSLNDHLKEAK